MPAAAAPVFEQLRAWRAAVAKEQGMPAYVIFHDATLRQIAIQLPSSLAELATVNGGYGLAGMRERLLLVGGTLSVALEYRRAAATPDGSDTP